MLFLRQHTSQAFGASTSHLHYDALTEFFNLKDSAGKLALVLTVQNAADIYAVSINTYSLRLRADRRSSLGPLTSLPELPPAGTEWRYCLQEVFKPEDGSGPAYL